MLGQHRRLEHVHLEQRPVVHEHTVVSLVTNTRSAMRSHAAAAALPEWSHAATWSAAERPSRVLLWWFLGRHERGSSS